VPGALAFHPTADEAAYSFLVNQGSLHDTTKRMTDLGGIKAQWSHLASC
jgi:hypothetical protein